MEITNEVLLPKHIEAGLKVEGHDHFVTLTTRGGRVVASFQIQLDNDFVREVADKYLEDIDYQC